MSDRILQQLREIDQAILDCNAAAHRGKTCLSESEKAALHEAAFHILETQQKEPA